MLAIALLLIGAATAAWLAVPDYGVGRLLEGSVAAVVVAVAQIGLAAALFWRVPGAWLVAIATLGIHLLALALFGLLLLAFVALPSEGGGPLTGNEFNALALTAIIVGGVGLVGLYALAIASASERRHRKTVSAVTEASVPH